MISLIDAADTGGHAAPAFIAAAGGIFAVFDARVHDSGNVSYGVSTPAGRFFVKTPGDPADRRADGGFAARVDRLRNAVRLHRAVTHPALVALRNVIEAPDGPLLVYDWAEGMLLWSRANRRRELDTPLARFRALRVSRVLAALETVLDLHGALAAAGWIASDFYDGSLLYDFAAHAIHVVDMDHYHHGPTSNTMGRMFGSSRYMAPEEYVLGAPIDERTTVFTLGRTVFELLGDGSGAEHTFRGSPALHAVAARACAVERDARFPSVAALLEAWRAARRARFPSGPAPL
jgi:serine/threonine-protein kinase